jgi:hypothetical protein
MVAPHVAGAWAILTEAAPTASVDEILDRASAGYCTRREYDADGALFDAGDGAHAQHARVVGGIGPGPGLAADGECADLQPDRERYTDDHRYAARPRRDRDQTQHDRSRGPAGLALTVAGT